MSESIGVALRAEDSTGTETLLAEADAAMYEAKRAGKGRVGHVPAGCPDGVVMRFVAASDGTCL